MAATKDDLSSLPTLLGSSNYPMWSCRLTAFFTHKKLFAVVTTDPGPRPTQVVKDQLSEATHILGTKIGDKIYNGIVTPARNTNGYAIWTKNYKSHICCLARPTQNITISSALPPNVHNLAPQEGIMIQAVQVDRVLALRNKRQEVQKRRFLVFLVALAGLRHWLKLIHKEPYNDAIFGGDAYVKHMLSGNEHRAQVMFQMSINVFEECSEELGAIDHEPASKLLSMDKQFATFLYVVGQNATNRQTQDCFQHSGETISRVFHHIIYLILQLRSKYMVAPDPKYTHEVILDSPKFSPFFDHCLGAMDGCHVTAFVPEHLAGPYHNQKGMLAQNVLGVVDFNMKFTYLMVGWEGLAHDSKVLGSALSEDF
ncbi:hypothetical protein MJO29_016657 [Puccinia striiformis f. sp. tritici]|nr:hypothetical protein MJO29_016657 [Puccinia striiformis f. sp. tritici]